MDVVGVDNTEVFTGQSISVHWAVLERSSETRVIDARANRLDEGAIVRTRRAIDGYGSIVCASCRRIVPPTRIEVDHRVPITDGGTDCDANILLICIECHSADSGNSTLR